MCLLYIFSHPGLVLQPPAARWTCRPPDEKLSRSVFQLLLLVQLLGQGATNSFLLLFFLYTYMWIFCSGVDIQNNETAYWPISFDSQIFYILHWSNFFVSLFCCFYKSCCYKKTLLSSFSKHLLM